MTETTIEIPSSDKKEKEINQNKPELNENKPEINQNKSNKSEIKENKLLTKKGKIRKIRTDRGKKHLFKKDKQPQLVENVKSVSSAFPRIKSKDSTFVFIIVALVVISGIFIFIAKSKWNSPEIEKQREIFA